MANVLTYWDDEGMPRDEKDGFIRLFCREVLEMHRTFIDIANSQLPPHLQVMEEHRPEILDP
jgi:hypothetical protein